MQRTRKIEDLHDLISRFTRNTHSNNHNSHKAQEPVTHTEYKFIYMRAVSKVSSQVM